MLSTRPLPNPVSTRPSAPLVPHHRSSVRRLLRRAIPALFACLSALSARSVAAQRPTSPEGVRLSLPPGGRFFTDTFALRRLPILGPFGAGAVIREDPARVAERAVRAAERAKERLLVLRWTMVVQAGLVPRIDSAAVANELAANTPAVARPDSGPPPGALVPVVPVAKREGVDVSRQIGNDIFGDLGGLGISLDEIGRAHV